MSDVEVLLTVGKLDASLALLTTQDHHVIEFPTMLLPNNVKAGSIVKLSVCQNLEEEKRQRRLFWGTQMKILEKYGTDKPKAPVLKTVNVTQTSCVLAWDPLDLGSARLKSLILYRQGVRSMVIPSPLKTMTTKISGLSVDTDYEFQLKLSTTSGQYWSEKVKMHTHKMTDMSGITVCLGPLDPAQNITGEQIAQSLLKIGARPMQKHAAIDTTHFVTNETKNEDDPELVRAKNSNIPIVRPEWVRACETERRIVGVRGFYLDADPSILKSYQFPKISSFKADTADTANSRDQQQETRKEEEDVEKDGDGTVETKNEGELAEKIKEGIKEPESMADTEGEVKEEVKKEAEEEIKESIEEKAKVDPAEVTEVTEEYQETLKPEQDFSEATGAHEDVPEANHDGASTAEAAKEASEDLPADTGNPSEETQTEEELKQIPESKATDEEPAKIPKEVANVSEPIDVEVTQNTEPATEQSPETSSEATGIQGKEGSKSDEKKEHEPETQPASKVNTTNDEISQPQNVSSEAPQAEEPTETTETNVNASENPGIEKDLPEIPEANGKSSAAAETQPESVETEPTEVPKTPKLKSESEETTELTEETPEKIDSSDLTAQEVQSEEANPEADDTTATPTQTPTPTPTPTPSASGGGKKNKNKNKKKNKKK